MGVQTMELAQPIYPMRAVIRCKAKQHLCSASSDILLMPINEALLKELATTLFRASQTNDLSQPCYSTEDASEIEDRLATELAANYRRIIYQQQNPLVQQLNALL